MTAGDDGMLRAAFSEADLPAIIEGIVIPALGASLIGADLRGGLGLPISSTRERIARKLAEERAWRVTAAIVGGDDATRRRP